MKIPIFYFLLILLLSACATQRSIPAFSISRAPEAPNYQQLDAWAAHPEKSDPSDLVPAELNGDMRDSLADVFFLHPTSFTNRKVRDQWNASIDDKSLNHKTDNRSIKLQASAFNKVGDVWAPRYRQAHLRSFFTEDSSSAQKALNLAYRDIRAAFEHFLKTRPDKSRPIIIAGHSQGAFHGKRLVREYFDNTSLGNLLVAAYLVGFRVELDAYSSLKPCLSPEQTGCLTGWRTYRKGYEPRWLEMEADREVLITNPLNWSSEAGWVDEEANLGGVFTDHETVRSSWVGAGIHKSILWTDKPRFPGSFLFFSKNYHAGDINLFYMNIRKNTLTRASEWYRKNAGAE